MAKKILIVCDDYNELSGLQSDFKKMGFDVEGLRNDARVLDTLLAFTADVVVALSGSSLQLPFSVGKILMKAPKLASGDSRKVILVPPRGQKPTGSQLAEVRMDAMLEFPVAREKLVLSIAQVLAIDPQPYLKKLARGLGEAQSSANGADSASAGPSQMKVVRGQTRSDSERLKNYEPFLQLKLDSAYTSHTRLGLKERQNNLKKSWNFKFLDVIDQLKREFVKALMRKPKNP